MPYYYLPATLVSSNMYVGDSLSLLNACFTSLDLGLYTLSTYTNNRINFLSSTMISVSSTLSTRINFLSTTFISVSSNLQSQINNLQVSSVSVPNDIVPFYGFTYKNAPYNNFDIALSAKGNGSILAQVPDNTLSGGNKRGRFSVDWQKSRTNASQVVSGNYSFLGGGDSNTVNGNYSVIGGGRDNIVFGNYSGITAGRGNSALSSYSFIGGGQNNSAGEYAVVGGGLNNSALASGSIIPGGHGAVTYLNGQFAHANGFFASAGDSQFSRFILRGSSVGTAGVILSSNGQPFNMPNNRVWNMRIRMTGVNNQGNTLRLANSDYNFIVRNLNNSLSCIAGQGVQSATIQSSTSQVQLTAITPTVILSARCSTANSNNWNWTAIVDTIDVAIPV